jgi:hypothetical protein
MNLRVTPRELSPLEIDPRPCDWCGLTIDLHLMVDEGEGPEFFCPEVEPNAANLIVQWERADLRDRWRHTGEAPPHEIKPKPAGLAYRTPQATIDAFFYVVARNDAAYLKRWLEQHPRDAETLCKLWEGRNVAEA